MRKKRILYVGEATYLSTGYSVYGNEVLKRLHATGKYEIAELACYGDVSDPHDDRWRAVPWKFYPVLPNRNVRSEMEHYRPDSFDQFGEWRFEATCIDFKPDIVFDIRDWWMYEYQERSPFRKYFHWALMPTVDAYPQNEQWLSTFINADAVFTYSDWALDVLRHQAPKIKLKCSAPPGADFEVMRPIQDRLAHRDKLGLSRDSLIVGTVMRNQPRKLYPDLFRAFAKFLKTAPKELADRTYLYAHTSYPDTWNIPLLIKENGIGHKTLVTYSCRRCNGAYPAFFSDARMSCRRCGADTAMMPNTHHGVSREVLGEVINAFDVYVQYANSEGFGMPQVEAAACGVPVMSVDYSAMADVVRKLKGVPLKVQSLSRDADTHCYRAIPDNDAFVESLIEILSKPKDVRARMGYQARKATEEHYTYDRTAKIWEDHFDSVETRPWEETWLSPAKIHEPMLAVPNGLSDDEFVRWGIEYVAGRPELLNSWVRLRMARDLTWRNTTQSTGGVFFNELSMLGGKAKLFDFNRDVAMNELAKLAEQKNHWETMRIKAQQIKELSH